MKKLSTLVAALAITMVGTAANAKINYTSIDGRQMCCDSVGPSGYEAHGCTGNPGGSPCAAKMAGPATGVGVIAMDRNGNLLKSRDTKAQQVGRPAPTN